MKNPKIMLYRPNSIGKNLVMLFLVFNTVFAINYINKMDINSTIFIEIMLNIVISLLMFLCATKLGTYDKKWTPVSFVVGVFECVRIFLIPANLDSNTKILLIVCLAIAGVSSIVAAVISYLKCNTRQELLESMKG